MIYVFGLIAGFANGFFASGAGQILIFYLIYILKKESHVCRKISICSIGIVTIYTMFRYIDIVNVEIKNISITATLGMVCGLVGNKIMQRIPSKYLNVFSGVLVFGFALYNLVRCIWK